jgi:hypothetical protein
MFATIAIGVSFVRHPVVGCDPTEGRFLEWWARRQCTDEVTHQDSFVDTHQLTPSIAVLTVPIADLKPAARYVDPRFPTHGS